MAPGEGRPTARVVPSMYNRVVYGAITSQSPCKEPAGTGCRIQRHDLLPCADSHGLQARLTWSSKWPAGVSRAAA